MRRWIAATLVLALVVTSGAMAAARGQSDIGSLMVICTGQTVSIVEIDADGTPIKRGHICPDCALSFMVWGASPAIAPVRLSRQIALALPAPQPGLLLAVDLSVSARGPPIRV